MEHLHGDTLQIIRAFKPQVFDALITDPPYASGGWKASEKNRTTNQKYSSMDKDNALPDFDGDQKDQRSWTRWMAEWLSDARKVCKPGAPICLFIDWRQYPSITDALQWAGWIWRGSAVWDKMTSRPQKGVFASRVNILYGALTAPCPVSRPGGLSAGRIPLCKSAEPHPCHREASSAHARSRKDLRAWRKNSRSLLWGRHNCPCIPIGRIRGCWHRSNRCLLQIRL